MEFFPRLFSPKARAPEGEVIYAIGDVHGRDDLLCRLHQAIEADLAAAAPHRTAKVIYLGDYIDRGRDSRAVLDRLLDHPVKGADCTFLKGNHEDAMLRFLDAQEGGDKWLAMGAGATARSYGVSLRDERGNPIPAEAIGARMKAAIPDRHLAFLRSLRLFHSAGDYFFVHAGIRPGRCLEDQAPQDMLWIRSDFLGSRRWHGKIVVHGHAARREAAALPNRICVDTMAYATDCLTCVVLEATSKRFISAAL